MRLQFLGLTLLFTCTALGNRAAAATYTLDQMIHRAGDTANSDSSREAIYVARAQSRQAHYLWLPQGDAYLSISGGPDVHCLPQTNCLQTDVVDLRDTSSHPSLAARAPIHNTLLNFTVSIVQPLYTFGKIEAADALGDAAVAGAKATQQRDLADLAVTITRAYWQRKVARAEVAVLASGLQMLKGWQNAIQDQLEGDNDAGYTEADLARIKLAVVNLGAWLADQSRWALATREAVRVLMGDPEADVDDSEVALLENAPIETLDRWQARAWERVDLKLIRAGLSASRAYIGLRVGELAPDLGLFSALTYGYNTIRAGNRPLNGWIPQPPGSPGGGFALAMHEHIDLQGGIGRLRQQRHEDASNRARAEQAVGGIAIEVAKSWADYQEAVDRAHVIGRAVTSTRGWVVSVDEDIRTGLYRDVREMWESFRGLIEFRVRHLQAIEDANIAYVVLKRASNLDVSNLDRLAAAVVGR